MGPNAIVQGALRSILEDCPQEFFDDAITTIKVIQKPFTTGGGFPTNRLHTRSFVFSILLLHLICSPFLVFVLSFYERSFIVECSSFCSSSSFDTQDNATYAFETLSKVPGLRPIQPSGAMYIMVSIFLSAYYRFLLFNCSLLSSKTIANLIERSKSHHHHHQEQERLSLKALCPELIFVFFMLISLSTLFFLLSISFVAFRHLLFNSTPPIVSFHPLFRESHPSFFFSSSVLSFFCFIQSSQIHTNAHRSHKKVGIDMDKFPQFSEDLHLMEGLVSEESVFCLPGQCFDLPNFMRIVLTVPKELTIEACDRMVAFFTRHYVPERRKKSVDELVEENSRIITGLPVAQV